MSRFDKYESMDNDDLQQVIRNLTYRLKRKSQQLGQAHRRIEMLEGQSIREDAEIKELLDKLDRDRANWID